MRSYIQICRATKIKTDLRAKGFMYLPKGYVLPVVKLDKVKVYYNKEVICPVVLIEGHEHVLPEDSFRSMSVKECSYFQQEVYVTEEFEGIPLASGLPLKFKTGQVLTIETFHSENYLPVVFVGTEAYSINYDKIIFRYIVDEVFYQKTLPELWT